MEMIDFRGYIDDEKVQIAKKHLIPKQVKENGVKEGELNLEAVSYTHLTLPTSDLV